MRARSAPAVKDILLAGAGHSHVQVLRRFGMRPEPGLRLTIIAREVETPYSGMLPGHVAGVYERSEMHIDVARLARFAGANFIAGEVVGVEPDANRARLRGRPPMRYDILSINTGGVPGGGLEPADWITPVKPIGRFLPRWEAVAERLARETVRLVIVGGGPGGVELALAVRARFPDTARCVLVTADRNILPGHAFTVRRKLRALLREKNVEVVTEFLAEDADIDAIRARDGRAIEHDHVFWVTGVDASDAFSHSGLATDERGFIAVNGHLQSISHENVFASGDAAAMRGQPRPKSGVFAVRQGPALADNLRRYALERPLRRYRAQSAALALIGTAQGHAVASRGIFFASGPWVWRWKEWVDRRFMRRFQLLPEMVEPEPSLAPALRPDAPETMRCGGCGAKLGADLLTRVLRRLPESGDSTLLQGIGDDAAVIQFGHPTLVATCDAFRAMIDDPYRFGRIAAHHALNDLYAMNAVPRYALALVTVPSMADALMEEELFQVMSGAVAVFGEQGVSLAGGHSAEGAELSVGFAAFAGAAEGLLAKGGLCAGERLILTKPIGTGVILAGAMRGRTAGPDLIVVMDTMDVSSAAAARTVAEYGATACTDVTGFGLAGHLSEMTRASGVGAVLWLESIPFLPAAVDLMRAGVESSLQPNNERALDDFVTEGCGRDRADFRLLADPQTAGGLLAGVPAAEADACVRALRSSGYAQAAVIGTAEDGPLTVRAGGDDAA